MNNKSISEKIDCLIKENDVVIFMKGTSDEPQCGFSFTVVRIFKYLNVSFLDINVLLDNEMREGIKNYTNWPTVPQVYVKGNFIGGCDIIKEIFESGELTELLKKEDIKFCLKAE